MRLSKETVVFFDFDGTLTSKDSFLEFIKYTHGHLQLYFGFFLNIPFVLVYWLNLYPNDQLKERIFSYFYGKTKQLDLEDKGNFFSEEIIPKMIHPAALTRLDFHLQKKHKVYLLTASSSLWLNTWCESRGIGIIGTEFEVEDGFYTGKIKGHNCYGREKVNRIKQMFSNFEDLVTYGYGDSKSDEYFLDIVDFGFKILLKKKKITLSPF